MAAQQIEFKRSGDVTTVTINGEYAGSIRRKQVSNSSPRGGAYRIVHVPILPDGTSPWMCYTRKEATEDLLRHHNQKKD